MREYSQSQLMGTILPQGTNQRDADNFIAYCLMTGLNPYAKEVYAISYQGRVSPVPSIHGFERLANESPDFDGMTWTFLDKDGKPLPKWADIKDIVACQAQVHLKSRKYPVETVVTMKEADTGQGQWKFPEKRAHMLSKTTRSRALQEAFSPKVGLRRDEQQTQDEIREVRVLSARDEVATMVQADTQEEQAADAADNPLTLAEFGRWCAAEQIPQDQADRAKAACGLGEYSWQDLKQQVGALELVRARLLLWQEEGEPAEFPTEEETEAPTEAQILEELAAEARALGETLGMKPAAIDSALKGASVDSITDTIAKWQDGVNARAQQPTLDE